MDLLAIEPRTASIGVIETFLVVATIAAIGSIITWILYVPKVLRLFRETPWMVPHRYEALEGGEACQLRTPDGLTLRGTYFRTREPRRRGTVVFCHGLGSDRWAAVPYVETFLSNGLDMSTFDFRNHGESDISEDYQPLPWLTDLDLADTRAAIDYAASRQAPDDRLALVGISKGGNAALSAAAENRAIRAVVTDGAFPTAALQRHYIRRFMRLYVPVPYLADYLPDCCLVSFCAWARFLAGLQGNLRFVHVEQMVRKVRQPVFMVHGERDGYVPSSIARRLRSRLAGRSKMWIVPGMNHSSALNEESVEYLRRITRFLVWSLGQPAEPPEGEHRPVASSAR